MSRASSAAAKRALDVLLASAGLIVSAPLWLVIAAAIRLDSKGPVFFTQPRVGERGRLFDALKFRSMADQAERELGPQQASERDPRVFRAFKFRSMVIDAEAGCGAVQATVNDPRVTPFGRLMRATALDELPQLWNIFRGDMSFVGPRALRPDEVEVHGGRDSVPLEAIPGFAERSSIRPGLTGVAQIYAPRDVLRRHKFRYDRLYIRRRSFGLDVRLIALSFWITFRGTWEARNRKF